MTDYPSYDNIEALQIAQALPQPVRDLIRADVAAESADEAAQLDNHEAIYGMAWLGKDEAARVALLDRAGVDSETKQKLARLVEELDSDIRHDFNPQGLDGAESAAAAAAPLPPGAAAGDQVNVTGRTDPDEDEERAERRRKAYQAKLEADNEEYARQRLEKARRAEQDDADNKDGKKGDYSVRRFYRYGIRDRGDYLSIHGIGPQDLRTGHRQIQPDALKKLILKAVLEKGMTELMFVRRGRIDEDITKQVVALLGTDRYLQGALKAGGINPAGINVIKSLPKEPPVWCKGPVSKIYHRFCYWAEQREDRRTKKQSVKAGRKMAKGVRHKEGESLHKQFRRQTRAEEEAKKAAERRAKHPDEGTPVGAPAEGDTPPDGHPDTGDGDSGDASDDEREEVAGDQRPPNGGSGGGGAQPGTAAPT